MYTIRRATIADLAQLEHIYAVAREKMRAAGNPNQWGNHYPSTELITQDIQLGRNYLVWITGTLSARLLCSPSPIRRIVK